MQKKKSSEIYLKIKVNLIFHQLLRHVNINFDFSIHYLKHLLLTLIIQKKNTMIRRTNF